MPAFLTIITMPLTYSVAYGMIAGIMSFIIISECASGSAAGVATSGCRGCLL